MKKYIPFIFISLLTVFFVVISIISAMKESLTYDEIVDFREGRNAVLNHTFDIDPYNPPLTREIGVFPYIFTGKFYTSPNFAQENPFAGRLMMIFLGAGLLIGVFYFVRKFLDERSAYFTSLLFALEPTILANSHYVTMDIGVTLFSFIVFILGVKLLQKYTLKDNLLFAVATGISIASKITFLPFFFLSSCLFLLYDKKIKVIFSKKFLKPLFTFSIVTLFVIWSAYFFNFHVVIKERKDASRISEKLLTYAKMHNNKLLFNLVTTGKNLPLPLGDFIATLKNNAIRGVESQTTYVLQKNQWYLMPFNLFIKLPIPLIIFFIVGLFAIFHEKKNRNKGIILLIPLISILIGSFLFHLPPLVRYVLPAYPFIVIFGGFSYDVWQKSLVRKILFSALLLWYVLGTLNSFPHFISFANEFAGYPNERYKILVDSNMDWGQSLNDVYPYAKEKNIGTIYLSYFGEDNGDLYGLKSDKAYGSYKFPEICEFHKIHLSNLKKEITLISLSNWYACGYSKMSKYKTPKGIVSDSFLIF